MLSWAILGAVIAISAAAIFYTAERLRRESLATMESMQALSISRNPAQNFAWVEIDFGNGKKRLFRGEVGREAYPLRATIESIAKDSDLPIKIHGGSITEIEGIAGVWNIYRNSEMLAAPLGSLQITGGERYVIRLK